jgi:hypothetical protein
VAVLTEQLPCDAGPSKACKYITLAVVPHALSVTASSYMLWWSDVHYAKVRLHHPGLVVDAHVKVHVAQRQLFVAVVVGGVKAQWQRVISASCTCVKLMRLCFNDACSADACSSDTVLY